jgi:hypothetical protein
MTVPCRKLEILVLENFYIGEKNLGVLIDICNQLSSSGNPLQYLKMDQHVNAPVKLRERLKSLLDTYADHESESGSEDENDSESGKPRGHRVET